MKKHLLGILLLLSASLSHAQVQLPRPGGAPNYKASVASVAALPPTDNNTGDMRITLDTADVYVWDGASWQLRSGSGGGGGVSSFNGRTGAVMPQAGDYTTTIVAEGTNLYYTNTRFDTRLATKTTTDIAEGTNLYYTNGRFDTRFASKTTDNLTEGALNFYYTAARFNASLAAKTTDDLNEGLVNFYYTEPRFASSFATKSTTDLAEGTNLYYTAARFNSAFALKSTTDLAEGTNLYYTNARFDTRFGTKTTDNLTEGLVNFYYTEPRFASSFATKSTTDLAEGTNLYYTNARFDTRFGTKTTDNLTEGAVNKYYSSSLFNADFATKDTDDLAEGATNLYFTDSRAQTAVVIDSVADGDTTHAPSRNAVYDELQLTEKLANKNQNNGYAGLDGGGKIPAALLPNSVMEFQGQWNANTNSPTLTNGTGNTGDVYRANVAGSTDFGAGPISFAVGDWAVYNGTIWEYASNSNSVMSVNGQTGVVVLDTDDVAEGVVNLYFTAQRVRDTLLTGFTSGAGLITAADSVLSAIEKLDGNISANTTSINNKIDGVASSVDGEIILFNGTTGKASKRATGTGFVKATSGVYSTAASIDLTADVSNTLPIANGGTGQVTASAAFGALSPLTTKGDILGFDTANIRVPVGADTFVLTADSAQASGLKWAAIPSAPVTSVFGRTGVVVATNGDYTASQITNVPAGNISSVTVQAALNELDSEKQAAGNYLTALTGDGTATGPGSATFTLATVNGNVGSFGTASSVGSFTVNGKGLVTAASNTPIQIVQAQVTTQASVTVSTSVALAAPTRFYVADTSGGAITLTLPAASSNNGHEFNVINGTFGGSNNVTISLTGGDLLNGGTSDTLTPGESRRYFSDGTNWFALN